MNPKAYHEIYRPQFHFTARKNWLNDPNGLVYYRGEFHLFFQHNPFGLKAGNTSWGHAVSTDLVRWHQLDHALYPDDLGTIFSGSAVVDWRNTAGFKTGENDPLVAVYTSAGGFVKPEKPYTQSLAFSNDSGRTWVKYAENPVLGSLRERNRDPNVFWHRPTEKWIMVLFLEGNEFAVLSSANLKHWRMESSLLLPGSKECCDLFELPVDGCPETRKWVFVGGNGFYYVGNFDGRRFEPESEVLAMDRGANFYATQTWNDVPETDGRRIQIAWMDHGQYPGMPFNQQMSFPCELTLRKTPDGVRVFRQPVREVETIRRGKQVLSRHELPGGGMQAIPAEGALFDLEAEVDPGCASAFGLDIHGERIRYDREKMEISFLGRSAELKPEAGTIRLRMLVDRTSIELFGNEGILSMSSCYVPERSGLRLFSEGGSTRWNLTAYELEPL